MYGERLAEVYDLIYGEGIGKDYAAEAAALTALVRERNPGAASVLDVACGTGEHLVHLREHFEHVEGLELSEPMRDLAVAKLPDIAIHPGDMREFHLGRTFDAALCLFSAIGYLGSTAELHAALACMAEHLSPGGVLIVEPWFQPDQWRDGAVSLTTGERHGTTVVRLSHSSREGRLSYTDMHYLVGDASGITHFTERHELSLFTSAEYAEAFTAAGLTDLVETEGWYKGRGRLIATRPRPVGAG